MTVPAAILRQFDQGVKDTLLSMTGLRVVRRDAWIKEGHAMYGDVSGVIGLSGVVRGTCALSMASDLARDLVRRMLGGEEGSPVSETDTRDGIGELVNMTAGRAKALLQDTPYKFDITLPTIITGAGHEVYRRQDTPCLNFLYETETGARFVLDLAIAVD
ncbi:MAG TPA: chemotaxis protein CheX [Candidatus Hydrogenedentes bacterium]|nr:chemotaxis protein CheX [Candidatus Hydrogenedentota bacterium]HOK88979.1 chemotaxis protein CheX [Candidatus Hydrogenedentota bacterium]HPO31103.1 chemotaxis protein CheX [Candidatus Hydrogenedentota bacterium]